MKKLFALLLTVVMVLSLAACGQKAPATSDAQAPAAEGKPAGFPKGTITFICPWDAGGSSDAISRVVADLGSTYFGTNCVVKNSGGAGGTVATTEFKNSAADGYSICLEAIGVFTLQPFTRQVNYSLDDFTPVVALTSEPIVMVASKGSGITSLEDLKNAKEVNYGFSGSGSLMELSQKLLFEKMDKEATGISYDGSAATLAALLGDHIQVGVSHPGEVKQYIESGDVTPLGIFSEERDPREAFKDIPTFKEQGYDVNMSVWKFMIVPKNTPADITAYISETLNKITADPKFTEFCEKNNLLAISMTTEEMIERINAEAEVNKAILGK